MLTTFVYSKLVVTDDKFEGEKHTRGEKEYENALGARRQQPEDVLTDSVMG